MIMTSPENPSTTMAQAVAQLYAAVRGKPLDTSAIAAPLPSGAANADPALERTMERAAVVGHFDPSRIAARLAEPERERVLSILVRDCEVEVVGNRRLWLLGRAARRTALMRLVGDQQHLKQLLRRTRPEPEDHAGRLLRRMLRGASMETATVSAKRLAFLLQVADWVHGIVPNAPDPDGIRRRLALATFEDSLRMLFKDGFAGRRSELKRLRRILAEPDGPESQLAVYGVTGVGGVGKSTLLARFAMECLARRRTDPTAPPIILIDFDRSRFGRNDSLNLTFELTRQLGLQLPDIRSRLSALRRDARDTYLGGKRSFDEHPSTDSESLFRSRAEILYELKHALKETAIGKRPIVLILDTFEVFQSGRAGDEELSCDEAGWEIRSWLLALINEAELTPLKVIVAGRAPIAEIEALSEFLVDDIELGALDLGDAQRLLQRFGVNAEQARLLHEAFGGNPLVLRLLAQRLRRPPGPRVEDLTAERAGEADQELLQGVLYRRILDHVHDPRVKRLAHPGLVLRRVTPDLIRAVLAPNCDISADTVASDTLFARLANEVWLVRRVDANTVEHRRDLRRVMMHLIVKDPIEVARTVTIHRAAAAYYESGRDPGLSSKAAAAEALYHRLMIAGLDELAAIEPTTIQAAEASLTADLADLPPAAAAWVGYALGHPLSDSEGLSLPEPYRSRWTDERGAQLIREDEPDRALDLFARRGDAHDRTPPGWMFQAMELTVRWREIPDLGKALPQAPVSPGGDDRFFAIPTLARVYLHCGQTTQALRYADFLLTAQRRHVALSPKVPATSALMLNAMTLSAMAMLQEDAFTPQGRLRSMEPHRREPIRHHFEPMRSRFDDPETVKEPAFAEETNRYALLFYEPGEPLEYPITVTDTSFVPSRQWTRTVEELLTALRGRAEARRFRKFEEVLDDVLRSGRATSGLLLGKLCRTFVKFNGPKLYDLEQDRASGLDLTPLLLGQNPELRGPARHALLAAFRDHDGYGLLAEIGWEKFDIQPVDLRPDVFARTAAHDAKRSFATLVEFADRAQVLAPLLVEAHRQRPAEEKLALVADAVERWNRVLSRRGFLDYEPIGPKH